MSGCVCVWGVWAPPTNVKIIIIIIIQNRIYNLTYNIEIRETWIMIFKSDNV